MDTRTARKLAAGRGHKLGRFKARRHSTPFGPPGAFMYRVAHCEHCEAAAFSDDANSPAFTADCPKRTGPWAPGALDSQIERTLVCSAYMVPRHTRDTLDGESGFTNDVADEADLPAPTCYHDDGNGWRVYTGDPADGWAASAHPELATLLQLAKYHGCEWLRLDRDCSALIAGLPHFLDD